MSLPSFGKLLVTSALASGSIFSALTIPLVVFGSEPVNITAKGENIFEGKLQDIAAPYIGGAGLLSLAAGVASISVAGWRQATQQNEKIEQELLSLRQCLTAKEAQVEGMLLSEKNLESAGLSFFLEDDETAQAIHPNDASATAPQPAVVQALVRPEGPVAQPSTYGAPIVAHQRSAVPPQVTVQSAVSPLHAAQSFLSFTRSTPVDGYTERSWDRPAAAGQVAFEQIQDLQVQLQQIMSQIESLQSHLTVEAPTPVSKAVGGYVTATLPHLDERVQALESQWVMRRAVS